MFLQIHKNIPSFVIMWYGFKADWIVLDNKRELIPG